LITFNGAGNVGKGTLIPISTGSRVISLSADGSSYLGVGEAGNVVGVEVSGPSLRSYAN
jgi:hypothetical protein